MKTLPLTLWQVLFILIISIIWSKIGSVSMFEATTWIGIVVILSNQNYNRSKDD